MVGGRNEFADASATAGEFVTEPPIVRDQPKFSWLPSRDAVNWLHPTP
jgi:hypothetical protein